MYLSSSVVLVFHMPEADLARLKRICERSRIELKQMDPVSETAPLGLCAGARDWMNPLLSQTHNVADPGPLCEPLLVMAGFEEALLDRFLGMLKAEKLVISMKAVLTANNANWNALQLAAHIAQERQAFLKSLHAAN